MHGLVCLLHFSLPSTFVSILAAKRKVVRVEAINGYEGVEAQILFFQTSALEGG